jgi:2,3-bisphosphoglycerate-dependent phosphoglycerate mutase
MLTLVLLRHGQSQWNLENRFTGWWDVDLSPAGVEEARAAGRLMRDKSVDFDCCFTSVLTRAIRTLHLALHEMERLWLPVTKDWRLNERHYGGLTGLNKTETAARHGDAQVKVWRRSFDIPPPDLEPGGEFDLTKDLRYKGLDIPKTESLATTLTRVLPYWEAEIAPKLKAGENILIAAHGNSLRAIVKHLFAVPDSEITEVEIPTGDPLLIDLDAAIKVKSAKYLDAARAKPLPAIK